MPGGVSEPKNFYFLTKSTPQENKGSDADASAIEISPNDRNSGATESDTPLLEIEPSIMSWVGSFFRPRGYHPIASGHMRKVPTKVEPKVFFANERTFLAWLHMSVTLSSISIAIVAFAEGNAFSQLYGLMLMPVAIAFCCYSLSMYVKRSSMIRQRHPGPYEDRIGPIVLATMLATAIIANFSINLYDVSTGVPV